MIYFEAPQININRAFGSKKSLSKLHVHEKEMAKRSDNML
jgi:hypothetical protein